MSAFRIERHPEAFTRDKALRRTKRDKVTSKAHRAFVKNLPCVRCGCEGRTEAAHVRLADARFGKRAAGMGETAEDHFVVPLCVEHHQTAADAQHRGNEREWWEALKIDACALASALWGVSGDIEAGEDIVREHRRQAGL